MKKKNTSKIIKLILTCGKVTPAPPVGPALGQRGLSAPEFCKQFNDKTKGMEAGTSVPVVIKYDDSKKFTFEVKNPTVTYLLKKAAGLKSGAGKQGTSYVTEISMEKIKEIALVKMIEIGTEDLDKAMKCIIGSAESMGIKVVN
jgi:large subunit ribosomal protein L11